MTCVLWVNWVQNNRAAQRAANSTELEWVISDDCVMYDIPGV